MYSTKKELTYTLECMGKDCTNIKEYYIKFQPPLRIGELGKLYKPYPLICKGKTLEELNIFLENIDSLNEYYPDMGDTFLTGSITLDDDTTLIRVSIEGSEWWENDTQAIQDLGLEVIYIGDFLCTRLKKSC